MTHHQGTSLVHSILARAAAGIAACLLVVMLSGCFSPHPDIVGSWSAPAKNNDAVTYTYTFNSDGTASVETSDTKTGRAGYHEDATWMTDFGNVVMDFPTGEDVVFSLSLTGDSISDPYGNTYHRSN